MSVDTDMNISPLIGTNESDRLYGTSRSEVLSGRKGDDYIYASSGSDEGFGGSGDDVIYGQSGNDTLYGGGGPSYVDMGNFVINEDYTGTVTFLNEGAGYRNSLGFYKIAEDGTIYDVDILFPNASKMGSGGDLIGGVSSVNVDLNAGDQIGFFIVSNGYSKSGSDLEGDGSFDLVNPITGEIGNVYTDDYVYLTYTDDTGTNYINSQYGSHLFHSAAYSGNDYSPNPDDYPHTVGRLNTITGEVLLGFEDLYLGGDNDYDDTVFLFDIGQSNAQVLDPNLNYADTSIDANDGIDADNLTPPPSPVSENDQLYGGNGNDDIFGMRGNDLLHGDDGQDRLYGNSGNDTLKGGRNDDQLHGGKGDDILEGGSGNDTLNGNSGNDLFISGSGSDHLIGGSGIDTVDMSAATGSVKIDFHGHRSTGLGNDTLEGIEIGIGSDFDDIFKGDKRDNTFYGGDGDDYFRGLGGDDTFYGGAGADTYFWRAKDIIRPSNGEFSVDHIKDFTSEDVLDFSEIISSNIEVLNLHDWLNLTLSNNDVTVSVDFSGTGLNFIDVAILENTGGLDLDELYLAGSLTV